MLRVPKDQEAIAERARAKFGDFIATRVNPGAAERNARCECLSRELMGEAAKLGLTAYRLPREIGGGGANYYDYGLTLMELAYLSEDVSFPALASVQGAYIEDVCRSAGPELQARYAQPVVRGEKFGAFSFIEDADPFSFRSSARRDGGSWVLNGSKVMISGGALADYFITYLGRDGDMAVALVEREDPGVEVIPVDSVGLRSLGLARFELRDVRIPAERMLVPTDGLTHAQLYLNPRRADLAAMCVGRSRAIIERCTRELGKRERYGRPLVEMQNVKASLGRMLIMYNAARAAVVDALTRFRDGLHDPVFDPVVSAAKHFATESSIEICQTAMKLLGSDGYVRGTSFDSDLCSLLGTVAGGGTQDLLEVNLGEAVITAVADLAAAKAKKP